MMQRAYREPYDFSKETILQALRRSDFCCEISGLHKSRTPEGYLEIHHRVAIWAYVYHIKLFNSLGVDDDFMRSVTNAQVLSVAEHNKIHEQESLQYYKTVAETILAMSKPSQLTLAFLQVMARK